MSGFNPKDAKNARPIDELLDELNQTATLDFKGRISNEIHQVLDHLFVHYKERWRSLFAFRGQSKIHTMNVKSPSSGVLPIVSLHSSGYRFVQELDWNVDWWVKPLSHEHNATTSLYNELNTKKDELHQKLDRWRRHLLDHPHTSGFVIQSLEEALKWNENGEKILELIFQAKDIKFKTKELYEEYKDAWGWIEAMLGSLGQHYGLESHYLDFTYSPEIAARFALHDNWESVLQGERVYGCIIFTSLPFLYWQMKDFKSPWMPQNPTIVDISWIPQHIAKRPGLQQGLSLLNSPSPIHGHHLLQAKVTGAAPFYTVPCKYMDEIIKMNPFPGDDPFQQVIDEFQKSEVSR